MKTRIATACVCLSFASVAADPAPATVTPEWVREEIARQVAAATNALYLTINYGTTNAEEIARIEREQEERRGRWLNLKKESAERSKRRGGGLERLRQKRAERENGGNPKAADPAR